MLNVAAFCAISLILIWFGYPLLVAGLAAAFGANRPQPEPTRRHVSVVIATRDPVDIIAARVDDLLAADYPADLLEVIVALDHSGTVRPAAFSGLDSRVTVIDGHAPGGKASTLNAGVAASRGAILVFADAAQRFEASTISRLAAALGDPRLGAVSGALQIGRCGAPATLAERYWIFEKWLRRQEARLHSTVGVTGAVYAMHRSCWHPLPSGLILDDVYAPMSLVLRGYRVGFDPDALAYDERRFAPGQEFKRKARTLTGVLQLCIWLPDVLLPWRNPIWAQFVFHKLLRLFTPYLLMVMAVAVLIWVGRSLGEADPRLAVGATVGVGVALALLVAASRRVREGLLMAAAMQAAMIRATVNGMRGRWDVWSR